MKPVKQFEGTVFKQHPAQSENALFSVVGHVFGSHDECWTQAKAMTKFPVIQFKEIHHGTKC